MARNTPSWVSGPFWTAKKYASGLTETLTPQVRSKCFSRQASPRPKIPCLCPYRRCRQAAMGRKRYLAISSNDVIAGLARRRLPCPILSTWLRPIGKQSMRPLAHLPGSWPDSSGDARSGPRVVPNHHRAPTPSNVAETASIRITPCVPKGVANPATSKPARGCDRLLSKVITPTVLPKS